MAGGCRDCSRCTETPIASMIWWLPRAAWWVCTAWNIGLFNKNCPQCGHRLALHQRRADGGFKD